MSFQAGLDQGRLADAKVTPKSGPRVTSLLQTRLVWN